MNYYHLKKDYSSDTTILKSYFLETVKELENSPNQPNHRWVIVTDSIKNQLSDKLESYKDILSLGFEVHHAKIFFCKRNTLGGLHIDNASDPRHCSINIPISGCNLSEMSWVDPTQFEISQINLHQGAAHAALPSKEFGMNPSTWKVIETIPVPGPMVFKTDFWHSIDNRKNPENRVVLAYRIKGNPLFEDVVSKLKTLS